MAETRRRLAAIVAADVAAYSRLMGDDEAATVTMLNACREVFRTHIEQHAGRLVDTAGDSVLAVFDSVVEAAECAVSVQTEIGVKNADLAAQRQMRFRIGVNLGDIIEQDDGTIYGDGVNVAARLERLADAGGICLSESAYMQVEGKIACDFTDIGEHQVKNIARPVRAWRLQTSETQVSPTSTNAPPLPDRPSIAVLPFDNLSHDPEQNYLADGIAEDLITTISHYRWLLVIARNSTFAYKGKSKDVRQIGVELGVRYVLEGSVRRGGDRLRVTAQLIDTSNGTHVWAQRYDRAIEDLFDLQDEITDTISKTLGSELEDIERNRARRKSPENLNAWEAYQRGLWHLYQFTQADNEQALQSFERASQLDPNFAPAFGGLAWTGFLSVLFGYASSADDTTSEALKHGKTAVALDPRDAIAHFALGRILHSQGEFDASIEELQRSIELSPNLAIAHYGLGYSLVTQDRPEEGFRALDIFMRLSPNDPLLWAAESTYAGGLAHLGRFEEAVEWARRSMRRPNSEFWPHAYLASALGHLGESDEAENVFESLKQLRPDLSLKLLKYAFPRHQSQTYQTLIDGFTKAGLRVPAS